MKYVGVLALVIGAPGMYAVTRWTYSEFKQHGLDAPPVGVVAVCYAIIYGVFARFVYLTWGAW